MRVSSSCFARLSSSASSCTSVTLLRNDLISAVSWEILSAPSVAEPGAGKSGPSPPLSRRSIFSFRLASSDATKKKRNYVVKELAAFAIKPRSGLASLSFFINTLLFVCLFVCFFEFLFKGYPSLTLQTL